MRRVLIGGLALLFLVPITAPSNPAPLLFVFLRVDREQDVALIRPMIAPDIGVQLVSGAPKLDPGAVLRCEPSTQAQKALVDGQVATVTELVLNCGDHKFVVKGLDFSQRAK